MRTDIAARVRGRLEERALVVSLAVGLVALICVGVAAWMFATQRPGGWEAEARVVVLPEGTPEEPAATGYYETLSRGQIVGTFAEMLQLDRFQTSAARDLGLTRAERTAVEIQATVIPDSAMITVTASAPERLTAETMADGVVLESSEELAEFADPYTLELVSSAAGQGREVGLPGFEYALIMTVVALVTGVAVQQAVYQLLGAMALAPADARAARPHGGRAGARGSSAGDADRTPGTGERRESGSGGRREPSGRSRQQAGRP